MSMKQALCELHYALLGECERSVRHAVENAIKHLEALEADASPSASEPLRDPTLFFAVICGSSLVGVYTNVDDANAKAATDPELHAVWRVLSPNWTPPLGRSEPTRYCACGKPLATAKQLYCSGTCAMTPEYEPAKRGTTP